MSNYTPSPNPRAYKFIKPEEDQSFKPWYPAITPVIFDDAIKKGGCLVETPGDNSDSLFARAMIATDVGQFATKKAGLTVLAIRSDLTRNFSESAADVVRETSRFYGSKLLIIIEGIETTDEPLKSSIKDNLQSNNSSPVIGIAFEGQIRGSSMDEFFVSTRSFNSDNGAPIARPRVIGNLDEPHTSNSPGELVLEFGRLPD